ncbi:MAG: ATP-dependent exonuclease [Eikenella sp.]|nr:ATP-dependent exonuclease [Eikenella sp.]
MRQNRKAHRQNIGLRPLQTSPLRRISALCVYALGVLARSLAYLSDMSVPQGFSAFTLAVLLRLELHPHPEVLQRSRAT